MKRAVIIAVLLCGAAALAIYLYRPAPKAGAPAPVAVPPKPAPADDDAANRLALQAQRAQQAGDTDKAIDLYRQAVAASPDFAAAPWNNLGLLLLEKKDHDGALQAFERAAALSLTDPRPLHNAGIACARAGWDQRALDYYVAALERAPRDLTALRGAVGAAQKLGLADEASRERLRAAIRVDTSPEWLRIYEREQSRIDAALNNR